MSVVCLHKKTDASPFWNGFHISPSVQSSTIGLPLGIQPLKITNHLLDTIPSQKNAKTKVVVQSEHISYVCMYMYAFLKIHLHPHIFQRLKQVFQPPQPKKTSDL